MHTVQRRLAAIVAADVAGFSRLMGNDEEGTITRLRELRAEIFESKLAAFGGRIANTAGDSFLIEFSSAVDALRYSIEVQSAIADRNENIPKARRLEFRIGINVGDVVAEGEDLLGDGVNVAARIEALSEPGKICFSRSVHDQVRDRLKIDLDDLGDISVKNIERPVRVFRVADEPAAANQHKSASTSPNMAVNEKPSVAVLPFRNLSGDPEQAYFSDGITDNIIVELARCRELFVIARQSSFAYRDTPTPLKQIAQELGVQYILEGAIRRSGNRIRVTAQLIDPLTGAHLWVERYDRDIADIFEVQDEITAMIVNTLAGEISRDRYQRSLSNSSDNVNAYDHFLRASEINLRGGREDVKLAREEALKAIAIDPGLARAHAIVAWTLIAEFLNAWSDDPVTALKEARVYALGAVDADGREPLAYVVLGWVHMCHKDYERALAEQRRAIADNPGNAHHRSLYAFTLAYAGQSEEAIHELERAMLLNPRHPDLYNAHYGRALFNLRRYDRAIQPLEKLRTSQPGNSNAIAVAAACYAALGRFEDARATVDEVRLASPDYTLAYARQFVPLAREEDMDHFIDNLALAGL